MKFIPWHVPFPPCPNWPKDTKTGFDCFDRRVWFGGFCAPDASAFKLWDTENNQGEYVLTLWLPLISFRWAICVSIRIDENEKCPALSSCQ